MSARAGELELWAGPECSVVRLGERYLDELELTGHGRRIGDLDRLAALGVRAVRQPILWERTRTWGFADERLERLRDLALRPIVGLVHHGSGPPSTNLLEPTFASGLGEFAHKVASRYPWLEDFTPINEPLTTARFSALYGHWYPHARDDASFVRALLGQCEATRSAMKAIRRVIPRARLVQTEDMATVYSTPRLAYQAEFENQRRFLSLDLLTGRIDRRHPLYGWLTGCGAPVERLLSFVDDPCPPDVIGLNYYVTSDRFLDERIERYPPQVVGGNGRERYADVEAVRVLGAGISGHQALLELVWARYQTRLAITEAHLNCYSEEQVRWLYEAWRGALAARQAGADVCAVTLWAAFGAYDWDSLLTRPRGHYEPGVFDVRHGEPRPTALAVVARELAQRGDSAHPVLAREGWWRRPQRLSYPAHGPIFAGRARAVRARPILITGGRGSLGRILHGLCAARGLDAVALARSELDISDEKRVAHALDAYGPWAVINAAGYARVDDAERDRAGCFAANVHGTVELARACAARSIRFVTFSSDLVFDGTKRAPYLEDDGVAPLSVYGRSQAEAERGVLEAARDALVVRTSALFGVASEADFVSSALRELGAQRPFCVDDDRVASPTYVPDLVHATLSLLVDGGQGLFHLATPGTVTLLELARTAAELAGVASDGLELCTGAQNERRAPRPRYSALASRRAALLPPLADALARCVAARFSGSAPFSEA